MTETELLERAVSSAQRERDEWYDIARQLRSDNGRLLLELDTLRSKAGLYLEAIQQGIPPITPVVISDDEAPIHERH